MRIAGLVQLYSRHGSKKRLLWEDHNLLVNLGKEKVAKTLAAQHPVFAGVSGSDILKNSYPRFTAFGLNTVGGGTSAAAGDTNLNELVNSNTPPLYGYGDSIKEFTDITFPNSDQVTLITLYEHYECNVNNMKEAGLFSGTLSATGLYTAENMGGALSGGNVVSHTLAHIAAGVKPGSVFVTATMGGNPIVLQDDMAGEFTVISGTATVNAAASGVNYATGDLDLDLNEGAITAATVSYQEAIAIGTTGLTLVARSTGFTISKSSSTPLQVEWTLTIQAA